MSLTSSFQVRSDVFEQIPAGGHQGYAALGGLYTQARPLNPHLYGPVEYQQLLWPVRHLYIIQMN